MIRRAAVVLAACAAVIASLPSAPATAIDTSINSSAQYYLAHWNVPQLWTDGARGQHVRIAEIDTGVDAGLATFAGGRIVRGTDFGRDGGDGTTDRDVDAYGHGTAMASIMVGRPAALGLRGIAPDASVLPIAIPLTGTSEAAVYDYLPEAIKYAADHGAKIISMSLGGVRRPTDNATSCPDHEQQAIYYAMRKGAVLFAAGGNRGGRDNAIEEPGVCLGVVSVGAVDRSDRVASFSSRHRYLTMSAPGVAIASIGKGGLPYSGDGTSQATAVASACAALVWSAYPALTASQLIARMLATVDDKRATRDSSYGYGIVDPHRAITQNVPLNAPDPVWQLARPFLDTAQTLPSGPTVPAPKRAAAPPGRFTVAASVPDIGTRVPVGLAVAGGGLVGLLALTMSVRVRRRRARRRAYEAVAAAATVPS